MLTQEQEYIVRQSLVRGVARTPRMPVKSDAQRFEGSQSILMSFGHHLEVRGKLSERNFLQGTAENGKDLFEAFYESRTTRPSKTFRR
jgi:hypothetical protein